MRKSPAGVMSRTAGVDPSTRVPEGGRWGYEPHSSSIRETQPQCQRKTKRRAQDGSGKSTREALNMKASCGPLCGGNLCGGTARLRLQTNGRGGVQNPWLSRAARGRSRQTVPATAGSWPTDRGNNRCQLWSSALTASPWLCTASQRLPSVCG